MLITTELDFKNAKVRDDIDIKCDICGKPFKSTKRNLLYSIRRGYTKNYCSQKCQGIDKNKTIDTICSNCNTPLRIKFKEFNKKNRKSKNCFCSQTCSGSFNSKHKTKGIRRSKLELFLESKINEEFPNLKILPNDVTTIKYEIDLYFPDLKFGIEINGITHYEPIYGNDKFEKIVFNDKQKILLCAEKGIELCIVPNLYDRLTDKLKIKIWDDVKCIIYNIINRKI